VADLDPSNSDREFIVNRLEEIKQDFPNSCLAVIDLVRTKSQKSVFLIILKDIIHKKWAISDDNSKESVIDAILSLLGVLSSEIEYSTYSAIISEIFISYECKLSKIVDMMTDPHNNTMFQLLLLDNLVKNKQIEFLLDHVDLINELSFEGLKFNNWYIREVAIGLVSFGILNDEPSIYQGHLSSIFEFMTDSCNLSEREYISFWNALSTIFEAFDNQIEDTEPFIIAVLSSSLSYPGSSISKAIPLNCLPYLVQNHHFHIFEQILEPIIMISKQYISEEQRPPNEVIDVLGSIINVFSTEPELYSIIKTKLLESLENDTPEEIIISISILRASFPYINFGIKADWEFYNRIISSFLNSSDDLIIHTVCDFLCVFDYSFERELLNSRLFIDNLKELLVIESIDIVHQVYETLFHMYDTVRAPIKGATSVILSVKDRISESSFRDYLSIIAKAIESECTLMPQEIIELSHFVNEHINNKENFDLSIGSLTVARVLISMDDCCHEFFTESLSICFSDLIDSDRSSFINMLETLIIVTKFFSLDKLPAFENIYARVMSRIKDHEFGSSEWVHGFLVIVNYCSKFKGEFYSNDINNHYLRSLTEKDEIFGNIVLPSIKIIWQYLPEATFNEISKKIGVICKNSSHKDLVIEYIICLTSVLSSFTVGSASSIIINVSIEILELYFSRELYICSQSKGVLDKAEEDLRNEMIQLLTTVLPYANSLSSNSFEFAKKLYETERDDFIDLSINILIVLVESSQCDDEQMQYIINIMLSLVQFDQNSELIQNITSCLYALLNKGSLESCHISEIIRVSEHWWHLMLSDTESNMIILSNIAVLIWELCFKYGYENEPLLFESIQQFPPSEIEETGRMSKQLITAVQSGHSFSDRSRNEFVRKIMRILGLSSIQYTKYSLNEEIIYELRCILCNQPYQDYVEMLIQEIKDEIVLSRVSAYL